MERQKDQNNKNNYENKKNYRNYATYFKTYYKAIMIRQCGNSEKINAQINRTEQSPEIDPQKYSQLIFFLQKSKEFNEGKTVF